MIRRLEDFYFRFQLTIIILIVGNYLFISHVFGQNLDNQNTSDLRFGFTLDFEEGDLRGWEKSDNRKDAFYFQPTLGDNPTARNRGEPANQQGNYWIGTYERFQGTNGQNPGDIQTDGPQGTLTSKLFTIPSGTLSFLIGGGSSFEERVELVVNDQIEGDIRVLSESGQNSETMRRVTWDLNPYTGRLGRIRIIDESSGGWGHINVDDFVFSEPELIKPDENLPETKYNITLNAMPGQIEVGQSSVLRSILEPTNKAAEYKFIINGQVVRDWLDNPVFDFTSNDPGDYYISVEVRIDGKSVGNSERIVINVMQPLPAGGDKIDSQTTLPIGSYIWTFIILVIAIVVAVYFRFFRVKKPDVKLEDVHSEIHTEVHSEPGKQKIDTKNTDPIEFEIRLKPILDHGKQEIEVDGSLIKSERRVLNDD